MMCKEGRGGVLVWSVRDGYPIVRCYRNIDDFLKTSMFFHSIIFFLCFAAIDVLVVSFICICQVVEKVLFFN